MEVDDDGNYYPLLSLYNVDNKKINTTITSILGTVEECNGVIVALNDEDDTLDDGDVFVYGQTLTNGFNGIIKEHIYTTNVAATQQIDRELQAEKIKVQTLESQMIDLLARVVALESV